MPIPRPLARAPITEALIDIRVELPKERAFDDLDAFYQKVGSTYSIRQVQSAWSAQVDFSADGPALKTSSGRQHGLLLRTPDGRQAVQARVDGFALSRMTPYINWDALRDEAQRLWDEYRAIVEPTRITRLAVRYINRISIPLPVRRIDDYFATRPEVGAEMPQSISGLLMRLVVPSAAERAICIVTQASEPPGDQAQPFLLDLDVFKEVSMNPNDNGLWADLECLRKLKNTIFFASVTEKTLEMFS